MSGANLLQSNFNPLFNFLQGESEIERSKCDVIEDCRHEKLIVRILKNHANRMSDIIDINTGEIIDGIKTIEEVGEEILDYCIKAASGEIIPKAVQLHQDDFIPWKRGVSL